MYRASATLLLTLVLGSFVAASAEEQNGYTYEREPKMKQCKLKKPWRYHTYECPTCHHDDHCIKTECNKKLDGKADVTIDLECLFDKHIGFVAISYEYYGEKYCINNQKGSYYEKIIVLEDLDCKKIKDLKLRFIVQNKWWFNPKGKDLDYEDICYDKCTKYKPCHTCVFEHSKTQVTVPECDYYCKPKEPVCPHKNKDCPYYEGKECFHFKPYEKYVKVTLKPECRKKYSHVAFSYYKYDKHHNKDYQCAYHKYYGDHDYYSFKAGCKSKFDWYLEDKYYLNKYAPTSPIPYGDKCYDYFKKKYVCDQCGPYKHVEVPDCYKDYHHDDHDDHDGKDNHH